MRKTTLLDTIIISSLVILTTIALIPATARMQRDNLDAKCQSNMRRWAEALSLYREDNTGVFPCNTVGYGGGLPSMFNWVKELNPYIIPLAQRTGQNWESFMRCPNATNGTYPQGLSSAKMTYIFNTNLCTFPSIAVRNSNKVMMLREFDRMVDPIITRPTLVCRSSSTLPIDAFLTDTDSTFKLQNMKSNLHGNGSYIVFADGHVKYFTTDYFPTNAEITVARCWDAQDQQWYNYGSGVTDKPQSHIKSIAISP